MEPAPVDRVAVFAAKAALTAASLTGDQHIAMPGATP